MATLHDINHNAGGAVTNFWDSETDPSNGIAVKGAAGLNGTANGLAFDMTVNDTMEVDSVWTPPATDELFFSCYLDPNGNTTITEEDIFTTGIEIDGGNFLFKLRISNSPLYAVLDYGRDAGGFTSVPGGSALSDAPHLIEIELIKETTSSSADGIIRWWIDSVLEGEETSADNFALFENVDQIWALITGAGSGGGSGDFYFDEILITDNVTPSTFIGQRALVQAIDQESGAIIYLTSWEDGNLYLYNRALSDLSETSKADFGAATATNLAARNNYLAPYTPAFPDITGFGDYVYAYGRWNDGSVKHLALSTSAGATGTFGSNLGDATWGSDWVGAFFADDTSTFYAFVNGSSRALWRSVDGGSNWTSLSSLPFDVDPGGAVKHPDGRILIINRSTGSQMAAIAQPPDYSSWVDATGSPAFPQAGGGARSVKWIV